MRKYYFKDSAGQQHGPLKIDKLKDKGITASTPVWYDGLEKWTTAGQVDELKTLINPPVIQVTEPVAPAPVVVPPVVPAEKPEVVETTPVPAPTPTPVPTPTPTPAPVISVAPAAAAKPAVAVKQERAPRQKGPAWVTYTLSLLVIAGVGYFIYQDMEKNKPGSAEMVLGETETNTANNQTEINPVNTQPVGTTEGPTDTVVTTTTTPPNPDPTTATVTPTSLKDLAAVKKAEDEKKKQQAAAAKKKAEDEKKKQVAADALKKEEEKKKQLAAQAAKETDMRNNWSRYINLGEIKFEKDDDGIKAFPVTVYNGMPVSLDKVTLRVDYLKKEGKVVHTETYMLSNIAAKGSQNILAKNNKKAKRANVYIIGATSRQLNFCYPVNSGNAADPYYCK